MSVSVTALANKNATATLAGVLTSVKDGTWMEEIGEDEITNLKSGGFYEEVMTIKKSTFSGLEIVYDSGNVPAWAVGSTITAVLTIPGGSTYNGSINVKKINRKFLNPKGAYTLNIDANSNGSYTSTM